MFGIYVEHNGTIHWVGDRETRGEADASAAIYNRDPLAQGWFYVVRKSDIGRMARERADAVAELDAEYK